MEGDRAPFLPDDWDPAPGQRFQAEVLARFNSSVHHPSSSLNGCFFLLAVFRRSTFRLSEESVSLALHSILGGAPAGFHVQLISDRHFRFSVASKDVGFHICSLRRAITKHFDVYFHLWRDGGSFWQRELKVWEQEQEKQWTTVSYKKKKKPVKNHPTKRVSFAYKLVQDSPIKKSFPVLAPPAIKIGGLLCPIISAKQKVKFGGKFSNSNSSIQSKKIFTRLKQDLCMDNVAAHSSSCNQPEAMLSKPQLQEPNTQIRTQPSQLIPSKQCFKCLAWGHIARLCIGPLRCKYCFGYYHFAKNCFRRKNEQRQVWIQRSCSKTSDNIFTVNWAASATQIEEQLPVFCDIAVQQGDQNQGGQAPDIEIPSSAPSVQPSLEPQLHEDQQSTISNESTAPVQSPSSSVDHRTQEGLTPEQEMPFQLQQPPFAISTPKQMIKFQNDVLPSMNEAFGRIINVSAFGSWQHFTVPLTAMGSPFSQWPIQVQLHSIFLPFQHDLFFLKPGWRPFQQQWTAARDVVELEFNNDSESPLAGISSSTSNKYKLKANMKIKKIYTRRVQRSTQSQRHREIPNFYTRKRKVKRNNLHEANPNTTSTVKATILVQSTLRRSRRLREKSQGNKQTSIVSVITKKRKSKPRKNLKDLISAVGNDPSPSLHIFPGPSKFPSLSDLENSKEAYPITCF